MPSPQRVLVTGGAGYVGAVLVPKLIAAGHHVRVLDLYTYGDHVLDGCRGSSRLEEIKGDIRDGALVGSAVQGRDTVVHLACISNDPSCDLDPELTKSVNHDAFAPLVRLCKAARVRRFIFASSSSVYGVSDEPHVAEDHPRVPVTDYNRYKAMCEDVLAEAQSPDFAGVVIRPATVCGYSPRLRLDLTVNILTSHAVNKGQITVFGGDQYRPNIHIQDLTDLYVQLVEEPPHRIAGETFNAGYENRTVREIADIVKRTVEEECPGIGDLPIVTSPSDDVRSYRITSGKIERALGFKPKRSIEDAVRELCEAFAQGRVPDPLTSRRYYNIETVKELALT